MIVYHGSNCDIEKIDLSKGSRFKDFGQGFYVTPNIETAQRMARKKADLFQGTPIVITYEFDESAFASALLKVLEFPKVATAEWLYFIDGNRDRNKSNCPHEYDIVKGPIADDGVALKLGMLRAHAGSAEAIAFELQDRFLDQQICFCTARSLQFIKKKSVCTLI